MVPWGKKSEAMAKNKVSAPLSKSSNLKTFLALGDSYTSGEAVASEESYVAQTVKILNEDKVSFSAPEIISKSGWTTGNLLIGLGQTPPQHPPYDIVTILIGVNNQFQKQPKEIYNDEFLILLNSAIVLAGNNKKHVIVLSIPDYSVTPFASGGDKKKIAKEIDELNSINKKIAIQNGVNYLEITSLTRAAAEDPSLIASDGLHPSGKEYKIWAEKLAELIKSVL